MSLSALYNDSTTNGITPFKGRYKKSYDGYSWASDVYSSSKEYHHSLQYKKGVEKTAQTDGWMLLVLLIGFLGIAYVRSFHRKRFSMLFTTLVNWKLSKQIIRYEKVYTHPANIILTLNFLLGIPLFITLGFREHFDSNLSSIQLFLLLQLPIIAYLLLKLLLYKFSAWLLEEKETIEEYVFQANLFNKYLSVSYLLLSALLLYSAIPSKTVIIIAAVILLTSLSFQLIRGAIIGLENGINLYFIIFYLCTLEFLPWLILGKWVLNGL